MTKSSKRAVESLAKEMLEGQGRAWETYSESMKAAYRNYARLVLQYSERR
jgi:hypothetical protein